MKLLMLGSESSFFDKYSNVKHSGENKLWFSQAKLKFQFSFSFI